MRAIGKEGRHCRTVPWNEAVTRKKQGKDKKGLRAGEWERKCARGSVWLEGEKTSRKGKRRRERGLARESVGGKRRAKKRVNESEREGKQGGKEAEAETYIFRGANETAQCGGTVLSSFSNAFAWSRSEVQRSQRSEGVGNEGSSAE